MSRQLVADIARKDFRTRKEEVNRTTILDVCMIKFCVRGSRDHLSITLGAFFKNKESLDRVQYWRQDYQRGI